MNPSPIRAADVRIVAGGDLRHFLRDPVTLFLTVVLPVVLLPAMLALNGRVMRTHFAALETRELAVAAPAEFAAWLEPGDHLVLAEGRLPRENAPKAENPGTVQAEVELPGPAGEARLTFRGSSRTSVEARRRLVAVLERRRIADQREDWAARGIPVDPERLVHVEEHDLATAVARGGLQAGRFIPLILVFLVLSGGMYTALDLFAGEKERGTLETLLVSRIDRRAVLAAKFLLVLGVALFTGVLAVGSLWGSLELGLISLVAGAAPLQVSPASVGLTLLVLVPLSVELTALMVVAAAYAPDFRTGQSLSLPLLALAMAPAGVAAIPGLTLTPLLAILPITGLALAIRDALAGQLGPGMGALVFAATSAHAAVAMVAGARLMGREAVLVGSSAAVRRRQAGRYGPEAIAIFALAMILFWYLGQLAQARDVLWGTVLTQLVFIGAVGAGGVAWLGLPLARTLQVRAPGATDAFLAVAAGLAAPGLPSLVFRAQAPFVHTPEAFAEQFAATLELDAPLWAVVVVFAVLPGLCEETLFRGAIQGLLRRSLRPAALCLASGALFGLMHLSAPRILPTAALGVLLAAAAFRSRSLWVAVAVHALNNAVAILASEWPEASPMPAWGEGAMAAVAVAAVALMGRVKGARAR